MLNGDGKKGERFPSRDWAINWQMDGNGMFHGCHQLEVNLNTNT